MWGICLLPATFPIFTANSIEHLKVPLLSAGHVTGYLIYSPSKGVTPPFRWQSQALEKLSDLHQAASGSGTGFKSQQVSTRVHSLLGSPTPAPQ